MFCFTDDLFFHVFGRNPVNWVWKPLYCSTLPPGFTLLNTTMFYILRTAVYWVLLCAAVYCCVLPCTTLCLGLPTSTVTYTHSTRCTTIPWCTAVRKCTTVYYWRVQQHQKYHCVLLCTTIVNYSVHWSTTVYCSTEYYSALQCTTIQYRILKYNSTTVQLDRVL